VLDTLTVRLSGLPTSICSLQRLRLDRFQRDKHLFIELNWISVFDDKVDK
jgi:hypothetical protein